MLNLLCLRMDFLIHYLKANPLRATDSILSAIQCHTWLLLFVVVMSHPAKQTSELEPHFHKAKSVIGSTYEQLNRFLYIQSTTKSQQPC